MYLQRFERSCALVGRALPHQIQEEGESRLISRRTEGSQQDRRKSSLVRLVPRVDQNRYGACQPGCAKSEGGLVADFVAIVPEEKTNERYAALSF